MTKQTDPISNIDQLSDVLHKKTFAEFFAGIGLMRMGLEREGWTICV